MDIALVLQLILSGLQSGSIYTPMALGIVLLYRTSRVLNFAHGEFALLAAFLAFTLTSSLQLPVILSFVVGLAASGIVAGAFYFFILRRAKAQDAMGLLILTLGFSLFANGGLALIWGTSNKEPVRLLDPLATWSFGSSSAPVVLSQNAVLTAVIGFVLMIALYFFVQRSRIGLAMRAVSQNPQVAKALGIPVNTVLVSSWVVAAILGGAAALLFAPTTQLSPNLMLDPLNKGFAAAVLGGITSLPGAVLGGYILGIVETIVGYINPVFKLALAFVLIIVVLVVRPEGLLGERESKRA
jgi:branched-chain amino acid transport system permease protein